MLFFALENIFPFKVKLRFNYFVILAASVDKSACNTFYRLRPLLSLLLSSCIQYSNRSKESVLLLLFVVFNSVYVLTSKENTFLCQFRLQFQFFSFSFFFFVFFAIIITIVVVVPSSFANFCLSVWL